MRCWECKRLIVAPEREVPEGDKLYSQSHTQELTCNSCGAIYTITTTRLPGRMVKVVKPGDEREEEMNRGWGRGI